MIVATARHVRAIVAAISLWIAALVMWWAFVPESEIRATAAPDLEPLSAAPAMHSPEVSSGHSNISERPLFLQSRRPVRQAPTPAPTQVHEEPPPVLSVVLVGTVLSPSIKAAVVRLPSGKSVTVAEGQLVDGWKLERVTPDLAYLSFNSSKVELSFPVHRASVGGVSADATPAVILRRRH